MTLAGGSDSRPLIVQVITTLGGGGAEREVARFAKTLHQTGAYRVVVCCIMGRGSYADDVERSGVQVVVLNEGKRPSHVMARDLFGFFKKVRPTVAHTHMIGWAPAVAKLAGVPVIVQSEHGLHEWRNTLGIWGDSFGMAFADKVVAVAEAVRKYRVERWKVSSSKVIAIPNCVEAIASMSPQEIAAKKSELGLPPDVVTIGMAGRLLPIKGWNYFIDSAAEVLKQAPECRFVLIGDGPLREELQGQIDRMGLGANVSMLGFREDVRQLMQVMDIVCLSSLTEGTPITILEAMACGKPAVVTDVGGCSQVVQDGVTGFVVQPRDVLAFSVATLKLVQDPALRRSMGEAGLNRVLGEYSVCTNLNRWMRLYYDIAATKGTQLPVGKEGSSS